MKLRIKKTFYVGEGVIIVKKVRKSNGTLLLLLLSYGKWNIHVYKQMVKKNWQMS